MQAISRRTLPLHFLITLCFFVAFSDSKQDPAPYDCGKIKIESSFLQPNSSLISRMITCKSDKVYFRTSLGLFHVSSIDYETKTLVISHSSCSSSRNYISPSLLSSGFPSTPHLNSVLLSNCLKNTNYRLDCTRLPSCGATSDNVSSDSCSLIDDVEILELGFQPNDLNCSYYRRVYRNPSDKEDDYRGIELGTRISFDIPDHVPDMCNECYKPNGNCGVGLRCLCHPKECKDKVVSANPKLRAFGNMLPFVFLTIALLASVYFQVPL